MHVRRDLDKVSSPAITLVQEELEPLQMRAGPLSGVVLYARCAHPRQNQSTLNAFPAQERVPLVDKAFELRPGSPPSPLGEGGVEVLRLAHSIDCSGIREIHRVVWVLLHVQEATRGPRLERGVRICRRDDPHPTVEGAKDQVTGKWGRSR
jgi:hypothetical protein